MSRSPTGPSSTSRRAKRRGIADANRRQSRVPAGGERGSAGNSPVRPLLLIGCALLVAACGGGGGTGSSANAPTISNLRVSYSPPVPLRGVVMTVQFIVDVVDADGDWVDGLCQFVTGDQPVVPVATPAPALPSNATSGTAVCQIVDIFDDETVAIDLTVVDQAGHQSNILSALVQLERRQAPAH